MPDSRQPDALHSCRGVHRGSLTPAPPVAPRRRREPPAVGAGANCPPWEVPAGPGGTGQRVADGDGSRSSVDAESRGGARSRSVDSGATTSWFDDDVLRTAPERQVLVVGDTIVGRTVAGLLDRCGYDPVLASANASPVDSALSAVGPRSLEVLAHLGIAEEVREHGTRIESIAASCTTAQSTRQNPFPVDAVTAAPDPMVLETTTFRRLFDGTGVMQRARTDTTVDSIARVDDGLQVEFANGVREWFDVVVNTAGTRLQRGLDEDGGETVVLEQYESRVDTGVRPENGLHDVWTRDALVQCVQTPTPGEVLLRVTTPADHDGTGFDPGVVADRLPVGRDAVSTVTDVELTVVEQLSFEGRRLTRSAWGEGPVARCGVAAYPVAPATGCRVSLGLQDGARFVTELVRGQRSLTAAVAAYTAERSRALSNARLLRKTDSFDRETRPGRESGGLRALARCRAIALGPSEATAPFE